MNRTLILEHSKHKMPVRRLPKQYLYSNNSWIVEIQYEDESGKVVELELIPNKRMPIGELLQHVQCQLDLHVPDTVVDCEYKVYRLNTKRKPK